MPILAHLSPQSKRSTPRSTSQKLSQDSFEDVDKDKQRVHLHDVLSGISHSSYCATLLGEPWIDRIVDICCKRQDAIVDGEHYFDDPHSPQHSAPNFDLCVSWQEFVSSLRNQSDCFRKHAEDLSSRLSNEGQRMLENMLDNAEITESTYGKTWRLVISF